MASDAQRKIEMATGVQEQSTSPTPTDESAWRWIRSAIGATGAIVIASTLVAIALPLIRNWVDMSQDEKIDQALDQASMVGESDVYDEVLDRWLAAEEDAKQAQLQQDGEAEINVGAVQMSDVVATDLMVLRSGDMFIASYPANSFRRQHCVYLRLYPHSYTVDTLQGKCNAALFFPRVP